jgi:hypothetical protein
MRSCSSWAAASCSAALCSARRAEATISFDPREPRASGGAQRGARRSERAGHERAQENVRDERHAAS